jgi:XTP/dITP diphosphohydrolase
MAGDLLVATTNRGKFAEVEGFLQKLAVNVLSLDALDGWPAVTEDGATFEENALKKARALAQYSGYLTIADDSGLEVEALGGAPGIYSARYSGDGATDNHNNKKLLRELKSVPREERRARFVCAVALCAPVVSGSKEWVGRATCEGLIGLELIGPKGFGYDPLFFYPRLGKTFGELDRETKAKVSHRGKALEKLIQILPQFLPSAAKP